MPRRLPRRLLGLLLILAGLLFCLVPLGLTEYETLTAQRRLNAFLTESAGTDPAQQEQTRRAAAEFNASFEQTGQAARDPFENDIEVSDDAFAGDGEQFAYLLVPKLQISLPIYLGATREHLNLGLAQVEGTSLPVGGVGTRSVIAGHRGVYTNNFFRFVNLLEPGDRMYIVVQGELLTYEVYGQEVIEPSQWEALAAIEDQDTLTLLTCTPPPVNSHRLLVDARRIPNVGTDPGAEAGADAESTTAASTGAEELRDIILAAQAEEGLDSTMARWQWGIRLAVLALSAGVVWTVVRLIRVIRSMRAAGVSRSAPGPGPRQSPMPGR